MERDVRSDGVRGDDLGLEEPWSVLREVVGAPGAFLDFGEGLADDIAHLPRHRRRVVLLVLSEDLREMGRKTARSSGSSLDQGRNASRARATLARTWAAVEIGWLAITCPVAGLITSNVRFRPAARGETFFG